MFNKKYLFVLAFFLLVPLFPLPVPVFAQEQPAATTVAEGVGPQAQHRKTLLPTFDGIVVQVNPLEVKSVSGEVRTFIPPAPQRQEGQEALLQVQVQEVSPKPGDLVSLTYEPSPRGYILKEIKITGATIIGTIKEIGADMTWLIVRNHPDKPEMAVNVPLQTSNQFQPLVSAMRPGDGVNAAYLRSADGINAVKSLEWQSKAVERGARWLSLIGAAVALWIVAYLFTRGRPSELYLGADNRYSSSKFQTVLWFWLVISAYIAIVSHRILAAGWSYVGGVDIPQNLLILSGISVLTFTAAKAITAGKVEKAATEGKPDVKTAAAGPRASDLISDDLNRTDLGDFQMVVITILGVIVYAISVAEFMGNIEFRRLVTMPDVDATLLSIFGLGQAAYLGKKAAGER